MKQMIQASWMLLAVMLLTLAMAPQAQAQATQLDAENAMGQAAMLRDAAETEWSYSLTAQITAWNDYDDVFDYYWNTHVGLSGRDQEIEDMLGDAYMLAFSGDTDFDDGLENVNFGNDCADNAYEHYQNQLWTMSTFAGNVAADFYNTAYNDYLESQTHHNDAISLCETIATMLQPI
jgi:hypothetical protein